MKAAFSHRWLSIPLVCLAALALPALQTQAAEYLLVIDSSGSMKESTPGGMLKIEAAKRALAQLKNDLRPHRVGIMVFGHTKNPQQQGCCQDIDLVLPIGPFAEEDFDEQVERLEPRGSTPLAESLTRAKYVMLGREREADKFIVVVTDGNETCHGDPAAVAASILNLGINVVTHVVGFGVNEQETKQLRDIAERGGGEFREADDVDKLVEVLVKTVSLEREDPGPQPTPALRPLSPIQQILVKQLSDPNVNVRCQAAKKLGLTKAVAAVPYLVDRVQDDVFNSSYGGFAKNEALTAVQELAPERVQEALLGALESEDARLRVWAAQHLIEHGGAPSISKLSPVDRALAERLTDEDANVRYHAAESLRQRKAKAALPHLTRRVLDEVFNTSYDGFAKNAALEAVQEFAPEKVEEVLVDLTNSDNAALKMWAIEHLLPENDS
jgi:Mg-chelatase subunit ChlD